MVKKVSWKWEKVDENTVRTKVIGGWLVHTMATLNGKNPTISASMVFVPDRDHEWTLVPPFDPSDPGTVKPKVNPADFEAAK